MYVQKSKHTCSKHICFNYWDLTNENLHVQKSKHTCMFKSQNIHVQNLMTKTLSLFCFIDLD